MTEEQAFNRMRELDNTEKFSYAEKGRICLEMERSMEHRKRIDPETGDPSSITTWIRLAAPWSYSTCFAAMRDISDLRDIPISDLAEIPKSNFSVLRQLSTAVRSQPSVLGAAKSLRAEALVEHLQASYPNQHIETNSVLRFMANQTQKDEIEEAIDLAMSRGAMSRTEALVDLATNYRADVLLEQLQKENA